MTGRKSRRANLDIFWAKNDAGHPRLGLIVSKSRQTGVARNRLRRRLKEIFRRECQDRLPAVDLVIRTHQAAYTASFAQLRTDVVAWCEVAGE